MRASPGEIIKLATPGMNTKFMEGAREVPTTWNRIADLVPSTQATETYPWLGNIPNFSAFEGERKRRKFAEYNFSITNIPYETTVAVDRILLATEQYGKLNGLAQKMGRRFPVFLEKNVWALLETAATTTGYDGQYIVDVDHSEGNSGTQSNKTTSALDATTFAAGRAAMMQFKDDQGEISGMNANLLIVPPQLETTALAIVKADTVSTGGTNVNQGLAEVVVVPWLADTNNWYLVDARMDKPIIVQELEGLEVGFQGPDSYVGWNRAEYEYGAYWAGGFGFADWRTIYGGIV